jgi:hypothetical protein
VVWAKLNPVSVEETPFSNLRRWPWVSHAEKQEDYMTTFDQQVATAKQWFACPQFAGMVRH